MALSPEEKKEQSSLNRKTTGPNKLSRTELDRLRELNRKEAAKDALTPIPVPKNRSSERKTGKDAGIKECRWCGKGPLIWWNDKWQHKSSQEQKECPTPLPFKDQMKATDRARLHRALDAVMDSVGARDARPMRVPVFPARPVRPYSQMDERALMFWRGKAEERRDDAALREIDRHLNRLVGAKDAKQSLKPHDKVWVLRGARRGLQGIVKEIRVPGESVLVEFSDGEMHEKYLSDLQKVSGKANDAKPFTEDRRMTDLAEKVQRMFLSAPNTFEGIAAVKVEMRKAIAAAGTTPEQLAAYVSKMATALGRRVNVNHLKNLNR